MEIQYKIDAFEGPLDLLLYLISKHKVSINDVVITELIDQYIDYIKQMQTENLEIASEFLEMAARLVYIKTVSLLPVYDDAEKLKEELRGELSEYEDCKKMADKLKNQANGFGYLEKQPEKIEADMTYSRSHKADELLKHYLDAVGKKLRKLPPPAETFSAYVTKKIVSVSSRITYIIDRLSLKKKRKLADILEDSSSRSELVATFLAVLSLVKSKRINVEGEKSDVLLELVAEDVSE